MYSLTIPLTVSLVGVWRLKTWMVTFWPADAGAAAGADVADRLGANRRWPAWARPRRAAHTLLSCADDLDSPRSVGADVRRSRAGRSVRRGRRQPVAGCAARSPGGGASSPRRLAITRAR